MTGRTSVKKEKISKP